MPAYQLRSVTLPDFGAAARRPVLGANRYKARIDAARDRAGVDWLVVYADREHQANIAFLTGFEPRFEEALLLIGARGEMIIVTGNENMSYTPVSPVAGLATLLAQSLSLMAQSRADKPDLAAVLGEAGIRSGDRIGLVGWKYLEDFEAPGRKKGFVVPSFIVEALKAAIGGSGDITDMTAILMHPETGLRAIQTADAIAEAEWGAARASRAVRRIQTGLRPGESEREGAVRMGYAGEPMTCHPMLASAGRDRAVIGLASPSDRVLMKGDGVTTAVGYWGGLTARAGLLDDANDDFAALAAGYFAGLAAWYQAARIGAEGGAIHDAVVSTLARANLRSALNPGHLTGHDEWVHSPIRPGSTERIASGMPFQVDIIPVPMKNGETLNCEDPVTFADKGLRDDIARDHPDLAARFAARRRFVENEIGIALSDDILLLSDTPLALAPLWLAADKIFVAG